MKPLFTVIALTALLAGCQSEPETQAQIQGAGLKAYIDPVTGELTTPPPEAVQQQNLQFNTMQVAEEEAPVLIPLEGGGYRSPLNGRFMHQLNASIQPDGSVKIEESIKH